MYRERERERDFRERERERFQRYFRDISEIVQSIGKPVLELHLRT